MLRESTVETVAFERLSLLGYANGDGAAFSPEAAAGEGSAWTVPFLELSVRKALAVLNPHLPVAKIEEVARTIARPPHPTLIENNRHFHNLLTDGVAVEYKDPKTGETRGGRARLIDLENPANNDFLVVRQMTIEGKDGKTIRPDLIGFVNGLPLVIIELKDPTNAAADLNMAIDQFGRYKTVAPDLFMPNLLLVV